MSESPLFLTVDWILSQFSNDREKAQLLYREFVAEGVGKSPWEELKGQIYLESERFIEGIPKPGAKPSEIPREQRLLARSRPILRDIHVATTDEGILEAYRDHGYTTREIAEYLRVHYATVSQRLPRQNGKKGTDSSVGLQDPKMPKTRSEENEFAGSS